MTTKHVFTTPYGGREIWRDGKPFAILAKPAGAPLDNAYYIQLSAFGHLAAAAPDMAAEISKQIDWLKHARAELQGVARESLLLGFDQSIKYLSAVLPQT